MKTQETSTHSPDEFTLKEKLTYGIVGLVVIGGSFFIGRSLIRKARATSEEKKTYEEGNPATFAKQIKMAFENDNWMGWGTDEEALRKTLQAIPSKDAMRKVISSYQKLYARSMMADMQSELTTSEYNEMLAIIASKPETGNAAVLPQSSPLQYQSWAKRLKAAFDITYWMLPGTDEDAIKAVFMEMRSQADFWQTAQAYQALYNNDLMNDLKSELEFWEFAPMMDIIMKKPQA
ncbi:MAG: hypothetical protein J0I32_05880 [Sphingobacteriales bacterium]|nr:hypothetical protein [Sphingobacteriales bacterium]OJW03902.1 MAG: hypothetical protein BGO52_17280 [Sphingobacteriales bacterium 44-61]